MMPEILFTVVVLLVAVERVAELVVSNRNTAWSLAQGGVEHGQGHYPVMVLLHTGLLVGCLAEAWLRPSDPPTWLAALALAGVVAGQLLRWWCIRTLGRQWSTRVVVVPGLSAVREGPYARLRHPNYVAVVLEGLALPLLGGAWITAVVFTLANAVLLRTRIRTEEAALTALTGHGATLAEGASASPTVAHRTGA